MIKWLHPFELPWVMVHCSNDLNTIFFVYKFYEKWRRYYAAVTSYQYFISRSITWSCMCTRHCIGICNDGNVTVNVSPSLSWFYCMKHFPWIFCIFSDIFVFKNSWPVPSFDTSIAFYWEISSDTALVTFYSRFFPFSDFEMTYVTAGLRRTCSLPSSWPGHSPSVLWHVL